MARRIGAAVFASLLALGVLTPVASPAGAQQTADDLYPRVDENLGGPKDGKIVLTDCLGKERSGTCADVPGAGNRSYRFDAPPSALFVDARRGRRTLFVLKDSRGFANQMPRGIAHLDLDSLEQTALVDLQGLENQLDATKPILFPELNDTAPLAYDGRHEQLIWGSNKDWGDLTTCPVTTSASTCVLGPAPRLVLLPVMGGDTEVFTFPTTFGGERVAAASYDHENDAIYAITYTGMARSIAAAGQAVASARFNVHEIDRETLTLTWSRRLTMCLAPVEASGYPQVIGFGHDESGRYLYLPCQGFAPTFSNLPTSQLGALSQYTITGVARLNLPVNIEPTLATQQGGLDPQGIEVEFHPFAGDLSKGFAVDNPYAKRLTIVVAGAGKQRVYVFDAAHRAWVGSVPLADAFSRILGLGADPLSGRVYVLDLLHPGDNVVDKQDDIALSALDTAPLPVAQGIRVPAHMDGLDFRRMAVDPVTRTFFVGGALGPAANPERAHLHVFRDVSEPYVATPPEDPDADTHDIDEELATTVTYTGGVSGYGARTRIVGGFGGGVFTAFSGNATGAFWNASPPAIQALRPQQKDEGLTLADVAKVQVVGTGANATARGVRLDKPTEDDLRSRYGAFQNPFGSEDSPPPDASKCSLIAPSQDCLAFDAIAQQTPGWNETTCNDLGNEGDVREHEEDGSGVMCTFAEEATANATGSSVMSGLPIQVAYAESAARSVRDPEKGIVSTITSVARGITMADPRAGALYIDEVRSEATTWAKGRPDTAGSEFDVSINGVRIADASGQTAFVCGFAGADDEDGGCDPDTVVREINERFAFRVQAQGPRRELANSATGSSRGARALVQKDIYAWWSDQNVNGDTRPEVAGLTLIFYNDGDEASRLIVQLAGVAAESQYNIGDAPEPLDPGSLVIELLDGLGAPLAGGLFEVRTDPTGGLPPADEDDGTEGDGTEGDGTEGDGTEGDGTEGDGTEGDGTEGDGTEGDGTEGDGTEGDTNSEAASNHEPSDPAADETDDETGDGDGEETGDGDETDLADGDDALGDIDGSLDPTLDAGDLIDGGTCVTAEDGIGDCNFEGVEPGAYLVVQTAAPAGYAVADPFPVTVTPGFETTVSFTNLRTIASIEITLTDASDPPNALPGGEFVAYADDGDQVLGDGDKEHGRCTTDGEGTCGFDEVPLGDYVVHQESAPAGLVPAADVGFTLDQPEQVAELTFVNAPPASAAVAPAGGFRGGPETVTVTIRETIRPDPIVRTQRINAGGGLFGLPADVARFIARNPREALLIAAVWFLFALPAYLAARRRTLALVKDVI